MPNSEVIYDAANADASDMGENYGARLGVRPWPVTSIAELKSDLMGRKANWSENRQVVLRNPRRPWLD
jgi:hypothetical protein